MSEVTTILVIEDEYVLRESMADFLEDREYRVLKAENGRAGLELFDKERPDVVLTDLRMPELDGLGVLRHVQESSSEIPLIVVSGTSQIADAVQSLKLGAWDYILKPVKDMSVIVHAIEKGLERARLFRENQQYKEQLESLVEQRTAELEKANQHLTSINRRLRQVVSTTCGLTVCSDVIKFGATLLDEFAANMGASGGSLFLCEDDGLRLLATLEPEHVPDYIPFPLPGKSVFGCLVKTKKPLLIRDMPPGGGI